MPWAVLIIVAGLTFSFALVRASSISAGQDLALDAAEGHFRGLVSDNQTRALLVSKDYRSVLTGAVIGMDSPIKPALVTSRLKILAPDALPGSLSFFVIPSGGAPVWIGSTKPTSAKLRVGDSAPLGLWVSVPDPADQDIVVAGYTTDDGDIVGAVVNVENLLNLSTTAAGGTHGVLVTLSLLSTLDASPVIIDGDLMQADGHSTDDSTALDDMHMHDDISHSHDSSLSFAAAREITVFGQTWVLKLVADDNFLVIPASREVVTVTTLGLLPGVALFGLIHFLVRRIAAETERMAAEQRFNAGFDSSPIGFAVLDTAGLILELNKSLELLLGQSALDLNGTPMSDLVAEPLRVRWEARILSVDSQTIRPRAEVRYEPEPDRSIWVDETATFVIANDGSRHILLQMSDITEQRNAREELQRMVLHDELTRLANRTLLEDRLQQALHRSQRTGSITAVMFIDVDQFKSINDTLGHGVGDQVLIEIAGRLQAMTRGEDTIGRFGGDEFVMLCEALSSQSEIWQIAGRIRNEIATPFEIGNRTISLTVSIGIALCGPNDDTESLLRDSDLAMYQAKELGRDRAILFEREMRDDLIRQLELEGELLNALRENELVLYYQPVIRVADNSITGFEALCRWNHPQQGVLAPGDFLPAATRLGLLPTIDAWALDTTRLPHDGTPRDTSMDDPSGPPFPGQTSRIGCPPNRVNSRDRP